MNSIFTRIALIVSIIFLTSCAQFRSTTPLPEGTNVAVVSSLNNSIHYKYVGTTVFQNDSFIYRSPNILTNKSIENAVNSALVTRGYHVTIRNMSAERLETILNGYNSLSNNQKSAMLLKLAGNPRAKRVIVLQDGYFYFDDRSPLNSEGMGYLQRAIFGWQTTMAYGSVSIKVYDIDHPDYVERRAQTYNKIDNSYFAKNTSQVNAESIRQINSWVSTNLIPEVIVKLRDMGS